MSLPTESVIYEIEQTCQDCCCKKHKMITIKRMADQYLKKNLMSYKYKNLKEKVKKNNVDCSICCENYYDHDNVIILCCNHIFHQECLSNAMTYCNPVCPLCREKI